MPRTWFWTLKDPMGRYWPQYTHETKGAVIRDAEDHDVGGQFARWALLKKKGFTVVRVQLVEPSQ